VPELIDWCTKNRILFMINTTYANGEERIEENEMLIDFMELISVFEKIIEQTH
jgi:hypothetical protein